ncbi:MAG: isochorismate synthase [Myxococcota bacterium]
MSGALEDAVVASVARAKAARRMRFLAWAVAWPELAGEAGLRVLAAAGARDRVYWERVDRDELHVAWGSLEELEVEGPERHAFVRTWQRDLLDRIDRAGAPRPRARPILVGGFAFGDRASAEPDWKSFPAARFVLPEGIVDRVGGSGGGVLLARIEPHASPEAIAAALRVRIARLGETIGAGREAIAAAIGWDAPTRPTASDPTCEAVLSTDEDEARHPFGEEASSLGPEYRVRADRSHARFRRQVREALAEIASGRLAKIVLARSLAVEHDGRFDVPAFLARLRGLYPTCTLVAVGRGTDTFLAATPETLVRVEGTRVETVALAGSAARGRTPEEDRSLAEALLGSAKDRAEHAHVVEAIRAVLGPRCTRLDVARAPRLRPLFGIQHLETPIAGELAPADAASDDNDVLALVAALHPTPAVAGAPTRAAAEWLARHEGLERGWYAAPIGWLDAAGGGAFCVALRSALIRNGVGPTGEPGASRARLFAGAGIVPGSDPELELVETRIKLRALLAPLTEI